MAYNQGYGACSADPYRSSERNALYCRILDPRLHDTGVVDNPPFVVPQFLEEARDNSTESTPQWINEADYLLAQGRGMVSAQYSQQYLPSESSPSLQPPSSGSSIRNGAFEGDAYGDPSTPGDTCLLSPGTEIDSIYSGDNCPSHVSLTGFDALSCSQDAQLGASVGCQVSGGFDGLENSVGLEMQDASSIHGGPRPPFSMATATGTTPTMGPHITAYGSGLIPNLDISSPPIAAHSPGHSEPRVKAESTVIVRRVSAPSRGARQSKRSGRGIQKQQRGHKHQKPLATINSSDLACMQCRSARFKDEASLDKHVRTQHTRPFICVFHYAGCESTFAAKNEWKRHVASQHICLEYYHCDYGNCATSKTPASKRRYECQPHYGGLFSRKDLYTQHVRRMHKPKNMSKKQALQWEKQVKHMQETARHRRCELPRHMHCPAIDCSEQFVGENAWNERMEHVARHLERAAAGKEYPVQFGGAGDPSLTDWAESPGVDVVRRVAGGWELNSKNSIEADSVRDSSDSGDNTLDEDAEGEEC
ncbi:hypothetical protein ACRE_044670 [Hapsidospora chrysogenum ATCC 11550]|uniref:C2H2-type domain-containing protein n=1 Tax=Hapsidospora chrysogenum (strain ATCC 11550 / CBS 779.69 / DSM 880 / IAM 14645 / JCM 23072 / IMI 49137) TaxID=857340 RepID=A0A086T5T5_HAPC1|nr:hypothetical protein ACRE_044670 [Hapsidospora chrysogenum ATCC 11550]